MRGKEWFYDAMQEWRYDREKGGCQKIFGKLGNNIESHIHMAGGMRVQV